MVAGGDPDRGAGRRPRAGPGPPLESGAVVRHPDRHRLRTGRRPRQCGRRAAHLRRQGPAPGLARRCSCADLDQATRWRPPATSAPPGDAVVAGRPHPGRAGPRPSWPRLVGAGTGVGLRCDRHRGRPACRQRRRMTVTTRQSPGERPCTTAANVVCHRRGRHRRAMPMCPAPPSTPSSTAVPQHGRPRPGGSTESRAAGDPPPSGWAGESLESVTSTTDEQRPVDAHPSPAGWPIDPEVAASSSEELGPPDRPRSS